MYFLLRNNDGDFLACDYNYKALLEIVERLKEKNPENNYQIVNKIEFDNYYKTW